MSVSLRPFTSNEIASMNGKWTHFAVIDVARGDVTEASANTEQVFSLFTPVAKDWVKDVGVIVTELFEDSSDTAYNTTTIRVGTTNDDDEFVAATEANANGSSVDAAYNSGDALPKTFKTGDTMYVVEVTLGAQSGKKLSDLDKGRAVVLLNLYRPAQSMLNAVVGHDVLGT